MQTGFTSREMTLTDPRHLSRTMTAITIPRQYDLTVNFFPRKSFGTNVSKILGFPLYVWNFTDTTNVPVSNPIFQVVKVLLCTNLQQLLARFLVLENIIQRLREGDFNKRKARRQTEKLKCKVPFRPLLYKDAECARPQALELNSRERAGFVSGM